MNELTTTGSKTSLFLDPTNFDNVQRACTALANSDLVPDIYRVSGKQTREKAIANCMIALDMANRLGADPLMVMQNMYIVYGRPGWSSAFLIATVNSCGRFMPLKFKKGLDGEVNINGRTMPNHTCYAYTTERGGNEELNGSVISMEMAKTEGWLTKNGSKWLTMPEQMLMYRAAAFWVRTYAPEISMGLHTTEEWQDVGPKDVPAVDVTPEQRQASQYKSPSVAFDTPHEAHDEQARGEAPADGQQQGTQATAPTMAAKDIAAASMRTSVQSQQKFNF